MENLLVWYFLVCGKVSNELGFMPFYHNFTMYFFPFNGKKTHWRSKLNSIKVLHFNWFSVSNVNTWLDYMKAARWRVSMIEMRFFNWTINNTHHISSTLMLTQCLTAACFIIKTGYPFPFVFIKKYTNNSLRLSFTQKKS